MHLRYMAIVSFSQVRTKYTALPIPYVTHTSYGTSRNGNLCDVTHRRGTYTHQNITKLLAEGGGSTCSIEVMFLYGWGMILLNVCNFFPMRERRSRINRNIYIKTHKESIKSK